jgi:hypothetical protein
LLPVGKTNIPDQFIDPRAADARFAFVLRIAQVGKQPRPQGNEHCQNGKVHKELAERELPWFAGTVAFFIARNQTAAEEIAEQWAAQRTYENGGEFSSVQSAEDPRQIFEFQARHLDEFGRGEKSHPSGDCRQNQTKSRKPKSPGGNGNSEKHRHRGKSGECKAENKAPRGTTQETDKYPEESAGDRRAQPCDAPKYNLEKHNIRLVRFHLFF